MRAEENFDVVVREFLIGKRLPASLFYLSGLCSGEQIQRLLEYMMTAHVSDAVGGALEKELAALILPCGELSALREERTALGSVYAGNALLVVSGTGGCFAVDLKKYPARSIEEPMKDKVLRGSRDGFTETLQQNAALIRRRIRDERLIFRRLQAGSSTQTDLLLCYIEGEADHSYVEKLTKEIASIKTEGLNLGHESVAELLTGKKWYNPFPKVRYTERPDAASAMLLEGSVILLCDNYPAAMILPSSFFDFLQDTDDFYFTPMIGGYLKLVRNLVFAASVLLTPVWYTLQTVPQLLPEQLSFVLYNGRSFLPLLLQLLLVEICIDGLKLASLNTPDTLSNSLGVISALILGDLAVEVGWLSPQVILYMAFVAIANFTQPSYEMGYAFKFMRIATLCFIAFLSVPGLLLGVLLTLILIASNGSVFSGRGYLYPLIPFNAAALRRLLFRARLKNRKR